MDTADERSGVDSADGCATKDCTGIMKRAATLLRKAGRAQTDVHVGRRVLHAVTSRRVQRLTCSRLVGSGRARFAHPYVIRIRSFFLRDGHAASQIVPMTIGLLLTARGTCAAAQPATAALAHAGWSLGAAGRHGDGGGANARRDYLRGGASICALDRRGPERRAKRTLDELG